ncbi:MAG TPA: rhomboid family intramembrane serine protease [Chitinophagaceae bacterium]|jgi:membrane associated rhomboid family serine protease|nr:rhomboid family intramembrane serine protease [Chitinophagaceae bacterium]
MNDFRYTRPNTLPPIVKNLIIINVLVFLAQISIGKQFELTGHLALYSVLHPAFSPYQIATHMFAHGSITHILFNMFGLWMFGKELENRWGPKRFLLFYLICGVGAALFHLLIQYLQGDYGAALGASGAIMGIFAAYAYLFPNSEMYIMFIPVPVKAKYAVIGLAVIDIFGGVAGSDGIAHFAHLGGALTGLILVLIWNKTDRKRFY